MKILTAIGNPELNIKLKSLENVFIIGKDVQYQEGVIELLEEDCDIDILIINENLPGEYGFNKLISEIKRINEKIEIYVFLEKKDINKENFLVSENIYKIYYLNEINFDEFIECFANDKKDFVYEINKEISNLKQLILNENKDSIDNYNFVEEKILTSFEENDCKIVAISGIFGSGKSVISSILAKIISNKHKTLLIDFDIENSSINTIFGVKKYKNKQNCIDDFISNVDENLDILCGIDKNINFKENANSFITKVIIEKLKNNYEFIIIDLSSRIDFKYVKIVLSFCDKIIFLIEPNLLEISKSNKILEVYLNDFNIDVDKIKILFNKSNKYKIAKYVLEEMFSDFEILEELEYEEKYNLFINKNTNYFLGKEKFEKIYEKLIQKKENVYASTSVRN